MNSDTSSTRFHLIYSVMLLVVIPGILILNTLWWVRQSKAGNDEILRDEASLLTTVFASQVVNDLENPQKVNATIKSITGQQPQITELTVFKLQGEYLLPIASTRSERMENRLSDLSTIPAWKDRHATYSVAGEYQGSELQRIGSMQYPLLDNEEPIGLINATFSFATQDQRAEATFHRSIAILFAAIVFVVLLLANYFRMIESTVLLQRLKEVDRMKDDFISMASHELRTPLTAIKGFASMLLEGSGGQLTEKGRHYVDVIMSSSSGLESLVGDMLDVSRIEQGRMTFAMERVDLVPLVQAVMDQLTIPASSKGLALEHRAPEVPVWVQADASRLRQILFNLIGNSVKYTEQGSVTVTYEEQGSRVGLKIADTGIGMSEEDRKKLFAKFYRIKNEQTEKITGTGLGLWITKQLVEKMGGQIEVESEVGKGSTFTVTIRKG